MDGVTSCEMAYEGGEDLRQPVELENGSAAHPLAYEHRAEYSDVEEQPPCQQLSSECKQLPSRELLNCNLQAFIDEINAKRKRDSSLLADYKKDLDLQCSVAYTSMEASVFNMYEDTNKAIEEKIQEFVATLERIAKLEAELEEFKSALSALYSDVHGP